jgi:hypothetical protein
MRKGSKMSEESRMKISEANRGHVSPMLGRKHSEEAKRKNREAHLGHPPNAGSFKKGDKINLVRKRSEEFRRKLSEARRGQHHSVKTEFK